MLEKFYTDSDETKEESEEDDDDIYLDQPLTRKFKVIICETNSKNMFYILNELVFNGESTLDKVWQKIWDWENKYYYFYSNILLKNWCTGWKIGDKIVWILLLSYYWTYYLMNYYA